MFLATQSAGGIGILLQSYAISLVPILSLATLNALKGIQYVFLIAITFFISYFHSNILKEKFNKKALTQKIVSILIIALGIGLLTI